MATNVNISKTKALLGYHAWKGDSVFVTENFKGNEYNALKIVSDGPYGEFVDSLSIKRLLGDPEYTDVKVLFKKYLAKILAEKKTKALEEVIWAIIGNKRIGFEEDEYFFFEAENQRLYGDRREQTIASKAEEAKASIFAFLQNKLGAECIDNMLWSLTYLGNTEGSTPERPGTVHNREYEPEAWVVDPQKEAKYIRKEARRTYKWVGWRLNEIVALSRILMNITGFNLEEAKTVFTTCEAQQSFALYGHDVTATEVVKTLSSLDEVTEEIEKILKICREAEEGEGLSIIETEYCRFHKKDEDTFEIKRHTQIAEDLYKWKIRIIEPIDETLFFKLAELRGVTNEEAKKALNGHKSKVGDAIDKICSYNWEREIALGNKERVEAQNRQNTMKEEIAEALAYEPMLDIDFDEELDF